MRGTTRLLVTLALATSSVVGLGETATAADPVTVTATDVTYTSIGTYTGSVDVAGLDPATTYDVAVKDPSGGVVVDEATAAGETTHHTSPALSVGEQPAGTYTVTVSSVATETTPATTVATGSFRVIEPVLTLRRYSKREVDVRLTLNGVGLANRVVHTLVYDKGEWYDDGQSQRTSPRGWAGLYCKKHHRCPQLFAFEYRGFVFSNEFRLYTGRKNGRVGDVAGLRAATAGSATTR